MALMLTSCSSSDEPQAIKEVEPIVPDAEMSVYLDGQRQTAWNVMKQLTKDCKDENLSFSPLSFYMAMSMLASGADGVCADELAEFLNCDLASLPAYNNRILTNLPYVDSKTTLNLANSVWMSNRYPLNPDFMGSLKRDYLAEASNVDFTTPATLDILNNWISGKTSGLINNHFKSFDEIQHATCILINALYFNSPWSEPFKKEETKRGSYFKTEKGEYRSVEMMNKETSALYSESNGAKLLSLPFGNKSYSAVFVLPPEEVGIRDFISTFDIEALNNSKKLVLVEISIPKFEINGRVDYKEILENMGMVEIFKPNRWSKVFSLENGKFVWEKIMQSVTLEIDEEGGTVAATTSIKGGYGYASKNIKEFKATRPFFFMIVDNSCNIPIVMGTVEKL